MRTSVSCRRGAERRLRGGFSLLELLVVLALVSIMVALVAPRLAGTVRAIASSGERAETQRQIEQLPLLARADGRSFHFNTDAPLAAEGIELPDGWQVVALSPLVVAANGICSPAQVRVDGAGVTETWHVAAPDCRVVSDAR